MTTPLVAFQMLDVSTAHLTSQTRDLLEQQTIQGALFYPKGPWGWFMYVPSLADGLTVSDELPEDLKQCLKFAQKQAFDWIMFDSDGAVIEGLPLYEEIGIPDVPASANARVLADSYARHLTKKLGTKVTADVTADGKITVKEDRPAGMFGKVSQTFAQAMVMQALPIHG